MKKLTNFLILSALFLLVPLLTNAQIATEVSVGYGGDYTTLSALAADINLLGLSDNTTVSIISDILEETPVVINQWTESGLGGYYLTILPSGGSWTIEGNFSSNAVIKLNGADRVIINGEMNEGERNLTISNTATTGTTAAIWLASLGTAAGCENVTIRNTNIFGSNATDALTTTVGISAGGTTLSTTGTGADNDNLLIENNLVQRAYYGISVNGVSGGLNNNLQILNNEIGSDLSTNYVWYRGVNLTFADAPLVAHNYIHDMRMATGTNISAIEIGSTCANAWIEANRIHGIAQASTGGWGAYGINVNTATGNDNITIVNNVITDLTTMNYSATSTTYNPFGIRIVGGTNIKVWFNSVNLYGVQPAVGSAGTISAALLVTSTAVTGLDIRSNVFSNSLEGLAGSVSYAVCILGSNASFVNINYNDYYVAGAYGVLGHIGTAYAIANNKTTLADWQLGTGYDGNSLFDNPLFTDNADLFPLFGSPLILAGDYIPQVPTDFIGETRISPPTIGAYEYAISGDMAYSSSTVSHPTFAPVFTGVDDQVIIRVKVVTEGIDNPISVTSFTFNTNGTTATSDLVNAKLFYTGSANQFSNEFQFGATIVDFSAPFNITGTQQLNPGNNYFWLAYSISETATLFNEVDAECTSLTCDAIARVPEVTAPEGSRMIRGTLEGIYTVGDGGFYPNLNSAFADVAVLGLSGDLTFQIVSDIIEPATAVLNPWNEIGEGGYYLTITPEGETRTIQGDFPSQGVIKLNGADRVIIDGELNEGERNLYITNNTMTGPLCVIHLVGTAVGAGCTDVTIRNCVISGSDRTITTSMGIILGGATVGTAPTGYDHDNCLIENNKFKKVYYGGVNAYAASTGTYENLQILNNEFGDDELFESLGEMGIVMYYCPGALIDGNHVHNLGQYNVVNYCIGFQIGTGNGNSIITNNRIHTIWHTAYTYGGAHGINITTSTGNDNILIANNAIYDLVTTNYNATNTAYNPFGIRIVGGTNISILHNSIHLYGTQQDGTGGYTNGTLSACIIATSSAITGLDIRNNTLSNTLVGLEGSTPTCIHHAGTNTVFTNIDYNNYYIGELNPGYIGKLGATWYQTFPEWQAATLQDANSLNVFPDYTADDNLAPFPSSPLIGAGTYIEALAFDILGNPRINPPTIGAYEVDLGDDLPPPQLVSPLNNSLAVPRLTQFEWNAVDGATSYYLQVANDAEFTDIIVGLSVPSTSYTLTTQLAATTQFYWRAKGEADGVIGYWSQGWKFITEGPLAAPVLISPIDGSEGLAPDNPLVWEAVFGADMYNIQISTSVDFTEIIVDEIIAGTVYIPSTLALQSDYWWRVSATNGTNISPWSEIWAYSTGSIVTIGNGTTYNSSTGYPAPYGRYYWGARHQILITAEEYLAAGGLPGLITAMSFDIFAVNNCDALENFTIKIKPTTQTTMTTFEYEDFTTVYVAAPSYQPIVGWNTHSFDTPFEWDGASNILIETCFFTNVSYTQNASHYYTVTPVNTVGYCNQDSNPNICSDNPAGFTNFSPNRPNMRFTMDISGLLPPQLVEPLNNSLGNPVTALLDWNEVAGAATYSVQVATDAAFNNLVINQEGLETSQYQITEANQLDESSLYYWRANATDIGGTTTSYWSQVWIFVTTGPLPPVTLLTPASAATGVIVLPTFTWQALIGAENYELELSNTPDFTNILFSSTGLTNTNLTLPTEYALENNATYYWRVRGYTGDNIGLWSDVWSFTTMIMVNYTSYLFVEEDEVYEEFLDGIATGLTGDDVGANFDLPFTFIYAGAEFNSVRICTNGWVRLGGGTLNSLGNNLASTTDIKMLAPLWDDLYVTAGTGDITYRVEGAEPARVYAVQFRNLYHLGGASDAVNFQVRIYENSGFVTFNYGPMTVAYASWNSTIGINGLVGGSMDFISVTPGTGGNNATISSTVSNNAIDVTIIPALVNKKYTYLPMGDYVTLLYPLNNSLTETDLTLGWQALEGATTYHLLVSDSPDFLTTIVDNDALTVTSFDLEDLDPVTMHYWKVRALVDDEWTYWSTTWRFTTVGPLYAPELIAPANASTGIPATINFEWTDVLTASDYQIQVASDLGFNTLVLDQITTETEFTWGLDMNSSYYWRVRASNFAFTGPWSEIWSFSTGSFFVVGDGTLTNANTGYPAPYGNWYWGAKHQILVTASEILAAGGLAGDLTSLSFNVATLNTAAALVNFEIRLKQTTATSLESTAWDTDGFTTVYNEPSLTNILGWNTHQFATPFPWDGISNILIDICFNNSSYTYNQSTYYTVTTYNSVRWYRADAATVCTSPGTATLSMNRPNMMFSGGPTEPPPPAPTLALPEDGASGIILNPSLTWTDVEEATNYRVQLATNSSFENLLVNDLTAETNYLVGTNLEFSTQYWWRVRSVTAMGTQGPWSAIWSFTTRPNVPWVVIEQTGNDATMVVQINENYMIGDRPFMEGDAIGLFYQRTPDEWYCAGYGVWTGNNIGITVWGDDVQTAVKDGYAVFEEYTFRVWDGQALAEYNATPTYILGESYYTVNGFTIVGMLNVDVPETQNISLIQGWNMISSYIFLDNTDIVGLFAPIAANLNILKNGAGQMYIPAFNINTIIDWNIFNGYLANMAQESQLTLSGYAATPETTPVPLTAGWNLSPYLRTNSMNAVTALASLGTNLVLAKNNVGGVYVPSWGLNSIGDLNPGEGYYLNVTDAANLTYPANGAEKASAGVLETPNPKHLIPSVNRTGNSATLLIQIEGANDGSEVGVYNINGNLIGSGYVQNGVVAANIWGDDNQTEIVEGASNGEVLTVKLYNPKTNNYTNLNLNSITEVTNGLELDNVVYSENSVYMAKSTVIENGIAVMNIRNTPNPVAGLTNFEFTLVNDENAEIIIYNIRGEEVARIENTYYNAGSYKVSFDASGLTTGAYNVVLRSGSNTVSTMMMVQK